jgi:hypothetical protein
LAEQGTEKILKKLMGKTDVEGALKRLDALTREENVLTATRILVVAHHIHDNVQGLRRGARHSFNFLNICTDVSLSYKTEMGEQHRQLPVMRLFLFVMLKHTHRESATNEASDMAQSSGSFHQSWHSLRYPSRRHSSVVHPKHQIRRVEEKRFVIVDSWQSYATPAGSDLRICVLIASIFSGLWKEYTLVRSPVASAVMGGLLSVMLSSAIIEDVKRMRESRSTLIAYYYFDFRDAAKRDVRGLLASVLSQLVDHSDRCVDVLSQLHETYTGGSDLPSEASLVKYLKNILVLQEQGPVYIIVDALDECPDDTDTPSAREKVLDVLKDLIQMNSPNLFVCITSRPEHDITTVLNLLTSSSSRVSLHEEVGQQEDINDYVRYFVQNDKAMRRWRAEDKELVINVLSERAGGM